MSFAIQLIDPTNTKTKTGWKIISLVHDIHIAVKMGM